MPDPKKSIDSKSAGPHKPAARASRNGKYKSPTQAVARTAAQLLLLKPFVWRILDVSVHGTQHLDNVEGAFVAVGNHSSHLDASLALGALPRRLGTKVATGAAGDYFFDKWWKAAGTSLFFNAFPIERGKGRGQRGLAGQLLSDGVPLLLFAEGSRSRTGAMSPFIPGAAALCISRGVPCLPFAIVGAWAAWPPYQNHPPTGRPPVHVVFGHPMMPQRGEIAHQFNERMRRKVIELHDTTARAYGMKTQAEYARTVAIEKTRSELVKDSSDNKQPDKKPQE